MANYAILKAAIAAAIRENGNNEITGNLLQQQLLAMVNSLGVGYQYAGIATLATNPGTPDQNVFYLASIAGTYTNFGGEELPQGAIGIFAFSESWSFAIVYRAFEKFVLEAKISDYPGYLANRRLAVTYAYRNDTRFGSGVMVKAYDETDDNNTDVGTMQIYWSELDGTKSGVEKLTGTLYSGGTIELTVNWDVLESGYNAIFPYPVIIDNQTNVSLQKQVDEIKGTVPIVSNLSNAVFGGNLINNNFNQINYYLPFDDGYGDTSWTGQVTGEKLTGKINGVFVGPIAKSEMSEITYEIYRSTTLSPEKDTGKTLIKVGTITPLNSNFNEYFIEVPETELNDEYIYVYFYSFVKILGQNSHQDRSYHGSDPIERVILYVNGNWYFGTNNYQTVSPRCIYGSPAPEYIGKIIDEKILKSETVQINLPNKFYAVVGDTLQIFYRSIIEAVDPYKYDIRIICNKGKGFPRYFSYTPGSGDTGTETFTVRLYNKDGSIVGEQSCQLVTVAAPSSPASVKKVFTFGDSLTGGGEWPNEAHRRLTNSNSVDGIVGKNLNNIDFCGSMVVTRNNNTTRYFGVGGWTWESYCGAGVPAFRFQVTGVSTLNVNDVYSNNGHEYTVKEVNVTGGTGNILCTVASASDTPQSSGTLTRVSGTGDATITFTSYAADSQNPLWDTANNKMSFIPYVTKYGNNQCDVVYVLLTWNGQAAWKTYDLTDTTQISYAKTFARKLHSEYPNAKLKIVGIQMPSLNGGLATNYGANSVYSDVYGLYKCAWSYNRTLQQLCNDAEFSGYCEFVDAAAQFDSENNMPENNNSRVNIRNSKTETIGLNGVHPADSGYYQIADAVYRNFVANFCQ